MVRGSRLCRQVRGAHRWRHFYWLDFLRARRGRDLSIASRGQGTGDSLSRSRLSVDALAVRAGRRGNRGERDLPGGSGPVEVSKSGDRHRPVHSRPARVFFLAEARRELLSISKLKGLRGTAKSGRAAALHSFNFAVETLRAFFARLHALGEPARWPGRLAAIS